MVTATVDHAFPKLTAEELQLLEPMASCEYVNDGDYVFSRRTGRQRSLCR